VYFAQVYPIRSYYHVAIQVLEDDKLIARRDVAITNLLLPQDWLGAKSWEVVNEADGTKKVFHGLYLLCNGGYL
jgi:hypothetical protein